MSFFGSKKKSGGSSSPRINSAALEQAQKWLLPAQVQMGFGGTESFRENGRPTLRSHIDSEYFPDYRDQLRNTQIGLNAMSRSFMNRPSDMTSVFQNNPFTDVLRESFSQPILQRQEDQRRNMMRELASRGILDDSSGIYARALQNRDFNDELAQSDRAAQLGGFNAYLQEEQQRMALMAALRNEIGGNIETQMAPLKASLGLQSSINAPVVAFGNMLGQQAFPPQRVSSGSSGGGGGLFGTLGSIGSILGGIF